MLRSARKYDAPKKASGSSTGPENQKSGYAADHQERDWVKLNADISSHRRAQWWGGAICLIALGGAIITALAGAHPAVSIALVGIPIVASIRAVVGTPRA